MVENKSISLSLLYLCLMTYPNYLCTCPKLYNNILTKFETSNLTTKVDISMMTNTSYLAIWIYLRAITNYLLLSLKVEISGFHSMKIRNI